MSTSNKFLIGLAIALLFAISSFGFYVGNNMEKYEGGEQAAESTEVKEQLTVLDEVQSDTTLGLSFEHVVMGLPHVRTSIVLGGTSSVEIQNKVQAVNFDKLVKVYVQADTLFIQPHENLSDYAFINKTGIENEQFYARRGMPKYPYLQITIHAAALQNLNLRENASVSLSVAQNYSGTTSNLNAKFYYGAHADIHGDFDEVNVQCIDENFSGRYSWSNVQLSGRINRLLVAPMLMSVYGGNELTVDSVWVNAQNTTMSYHINLHCEDYLYADLTGAGSGDVIYRGNPIVEKRENSFSRVINGNLPARSSN